MSDRDDAEENIRGQNWSEWTMRKISYKDEDYGYEGRDIESLETSSIEPPRTPRCESCRLEPWTVKLIEGRVVSFYDPSKMIKGKKTDKMFCSENCLKNFETWL